MTLSRTRTLLGTALTCLLVLTLQTALGGSSGFASGRPAAKADSETYTVTGRIPKTWHVKVLEIGLCHSQCPRLPLMSGTVGRTDVAKDGAFTMEGVPANDYGIEIRYLGGHSDRSLVAYLKPKAKGVYVVDQTGDFHPSVVSISGDDDLGVLITKSMEPHPPDGQVSYVGGGTLGGTVTLFYHAKHLRKVSVVSLTYYGCGHVLAHRRFTGLTGSHKFRLNHSLRHAPKWGTTKVKVREPHRDLDHYAARVGPVKGAHC